MSVTSHPNSTFDLPAAPGALPIHVFPNTWTIADFQAHLGDIPAERIRLEPRPGYATEEDLVYLQETKEALCELVDGILVDKPMGTFESRLAIIIAHFIETYLDAKPLGFTLGENGPVRTVVPQVRMPDVCYVSWAKIPSGIFPPDPVLPVAPDWAIEILSPSNTRREMARKLAEYFQAGTRLVWCIDPKKRTTDVYTAVDRCVTVGENDELDGGDVLPGFKIRLCDVIERANRRTR
jgi:Uma2 family endonuclease